MISNSAFLGRRSNYILIELNADIIIYHLAVELVDDWTGDLVLFDLWYPFPRSYTHGDVGFDIPTSILFGVGVTWQPIDKLENTTGSSVEQP